MIQTYPVFPLVFLKAFALNCPSKSNIQHNNIRIRGGTNPGGVGMPSAFNTTLQRTLQQHLRHAKVLVLTGLDGRGDTRQPLSLAYLTGHKTQGFPSHGSAVLNATLGGNTRPGKKAAKKTLRLAVYSLGNGTRTQASQSRAYMLNIVSGDMGQG